MGPGLPCASTSRWFAENAEWLSLESSLATVLASYRDGKRANREGTS